MKILFLSNGMQCLVDNEDYEKLKDFHWNVFPHGNNFYARRAIYDKEFYRLNKKNKIKHRFIHREILGLTDSSILVDHIDGNSLNNQRNNLRICTTSENMWNRKKNKNGSSRFKGVALHKRDKIWTASIRIDGKAKHIGNYEYEVEAALAYNVAASFAFREFAKLNQIEV